MSPVEKTPAHDRWACFGCRGCVKLPLVGARVHDRPSCLCPTCGKRMTWTGTAFRPPRRDDLAGWRAAERLIATGFRYRTTSKRQRVPRTEAAVEAWLSTRASEPSWLPETSLTVATTKNGSLSVRAGRRSVLKDEELLVWQGRAWCKARLRLTGDGGKPLARAMVLLLTLYKTVPVTPTTRVRLSR